MEYFFRTEQLTVGYNGKPVVRDIDIQLKKGQILTLIGPNGSGKSTILKSITKHLKSIYGTAYIGEQSIDRMNGKAMSELVSVVLTGKLKTELMTCEDIVSTGRYPYTGMLGILSSEDKEKVKSALELAGAWELRDKDFNEVSDGQRQRILLARAICQEPQIIVLDEPTSFLDIRYSIELLGLLRMMTKEKGITVIMSLHELDMANKVSDLIMCVKGEYITDFGPPEDIFKRELICGLFDLQNGNYNPVFGSFEFEKPKGLPEVFVIAGGGTGIPVFRKLQKKGTPFAAGILHENDIDFQVAKELASVVFSEKSFMPIGYSVYKEALKCMESCHNVINCLKNYGAINDRNRELADYAKNLGKIMKENI